MSGFGGTKSASLIEFIQRLKGLGWHESLLSTTDRMVFARGVFVGGRWRFWYCNISQIELGGKVGFYRWR